MSQPLTRTLLFAVAVCSATGSPASAQTPPAPPDKFSLEQLMTAEVPMVVGASRYAQQVIDAPATVSIVTRQEIERFGYQTLADILRGVRGLYVTYDRNYAYLGARGFSRPGDYNSRVLVLVNGHRLNDNIFEGAQIGTDFILDISLIDRVEIVRGPSSSLYGAGAFFGIVNVVTQSASTLGSSASMAYGSQNTVDGRGTFARAFANGVSAIVSADRYESDGQHTVLVDDSGRFTTGMDGDSATRLFGSVATGPWTAQTAFVTRTKGIPTGAYDVSLNGEQSETVDARGYADVQFQRPVRGASFSWRGYYDWYRYDGRYWQQNDTPLLMKDFGHGYWWGSEATATRRFSAHLVTAGGEVRNSTLQHQGAYYDVDPREWILEDRRDSVQWAAFAQDEFKLSAKWALSAGLRYDHFPTFGGTTSPRVGAIFKPRPDAALKLLHGTAFRAPNLYELYYYNDASTLLRPERIRTDEIAWEQRLASGLRLTLAGFNYHIEDLISQVEQVGSTLDDIGFVNLGEQTATGLEAELSRTWSAYEATASYTYTGMHDGGRGALSNSPAHLGRARLSARLPQGVGHFGVEWLYTSERATLDGGTTSGFSLANLTLTSRPAHGITVSGHLDNAFDASYSDPGGEEHLGPIRQDGRTARVRVTWHF